MTLDELFSKVGRFFSWLYYERAWSKWELLGAVLVAIALLLLAGRGRRKKTAKIAAKQAHEDKAWRGT
ncbi:MAG TPA: hypothetical protein VMX13_10090 [Sedimentisphaerales bacterium]|nr:hypothetical protein [Sedimentisphaerales bacterium]